jgi:hypothetical protein
MGMAWHFLTAHCRESGKKAFVLAGAGPSG